MSKDLEISCPSCGVAIRLDETLAGPAISKIRAEADEAIKKAKEATQAKTAELADREAGAARRERELAERECGFQAKIDQVIAAERQKISESERERAAKELATRLEAERKKIGELEDELQVSQKAELQLRKEREQVDRRTKEIDLEIARKVDLQRSAILEQASKEAAEASKKLLTEKENEVSLANEAARKATEAANSKAAKAVELESELAEKAKDLAEREASFQAKLNLAIASEIRQITATERENALKELMPELNAERDKTKRLEGKLSDAREAERSLRQENEQVQQRAKEIDLEVARKVEEGRSAIHEQVSQKLGNEHRLALAEREKTISEMAQKLEEAQRKATQGSQQTQGEVLEQEFEHTLRIMFSQDTIEPVKTGTRGADLHQRIQGELGKPVGTLLWEVKRAQSWGADWTAKAKRDAAEAKAEVALIVSDVLPRDIKSDFGFYEGIWCTTLSHAVPLALALRQGIIGTAEARLTALGRETKKERLYDYMVGPEFRATVEGIALPFRELSEELLAEKRATQARWKRQERRIERVLTSIASLQGDLQGIAGGEMLEIPGFELEAGIAQIAASSEA